MRNILVLHFFFLIWVFGLKNLSKSFEVKNFFDSTFFLDDTLKWLFVYFLNITGLIKNRYSYKLKTNTHIFVKVTFFF